MEVFQKDPEQTSMDVRSVNSKASLEDASTDLARFWEEKRCFENGIGVGVGVGKKKG
jgi:hypothetical protein